MTTLASDPLSGTLPSNPLALQHQLTIASSFLVPAPDNAKMGKPNPHHLYLSTDYPT